MIPQTYQQWRHCIIHDCGIALTADFITERLSILTNAKVEETRLFTQKYGEQHTKQVISWFEKAFRELE